MNLEETVQAYQAYLDETVPGTRLHGTMGTRLARLGTVTTELCERTMDALHPLDIDQIAALAGLEKRHATYVLRDCPDIHIALTKALLAESIAASSGALELELSLLPSNYDEVDLAELIAPAPRPQSVMCALLPSFDAAATAALIQRLAEPPFADLSLTVLDASRTFELLEHPLRTLAPGIEIAYKVGPQDRCPLPLTNPLLDLRPRTSSVVAEVCRGQDVTAILDPAQPGRYDLLARDPERRITALCRPSVPDVPHQLDGPRRARSVELAARIASLKDRTSDLLNPVLEQCRPRERGRVLENLCQLAYVHTAALAAAGVPPKPNQKDREA